MNAADAPLWVEVLVALLLLVSAVMALTSAIGLVRLRDFFARMHMPALTATLWIATSAQRPRGPLIEQATQLVREQLLALWS